MRITTYKMPGIEGVFSMGGEADDRVPADAIEVETHDGAASQLVSTDPLPPGDHKTWLSL